ncbi:hypothetical protein BM221_003626 [Beauveria bassiana]|uniref:Uncharacterized protein n=1 Tax=Beauveria bassiana TaxID=176275 RepID=A0A2N6NV67_BEABA|nr:hypothetical protein BM221_003626 [Beauveria bassiana]
MSPSIRHAINTHTPSPRVGPRRASPQNGATNCTTSSPTAADTITDLGAAAKFEKNSLPRRLLSSQHRRRGKNQRMTDSQSTRMTADISLLNASLGRLSRVVQRSAEWMNRRRLVE